MSLLTYEETRPWARAIRQKVFAREMPPWFIDKNIGVQDFSNDISLSDAKIATIGRWVDAGAPKGDLADMPPPRHFDDEELWHIGKPDLVVSLPNDIILPATGPDQWPAVLVDTGLTEDRYIKGVQIIPRKGFEVIHHIRTATVIQTDGSMDEGGFLNEYAIGKAGDVYPDGSGKLLRAGTKIRFQLHLHPLGKETPTNVDLGVTLYPKGYTPQHVVSSRTVSAPEVDLRPNTDNIRSDGYFMLEQPARLLSFQPHMHNRGKAECLEAIYPSGRVEALSCAEFNFDWHLNYVYSDDAAPLLPAGTVLHSIMWHDNTARNPSNPDPDAQITYGQRAVDEMASAWVNWYYMSEEAFQRETEARKANAAGTQ